MCATFIILYYHCSTTIYVLLLKGGNQNRQGVQFWFHGGLIQGERGGGANSVCQFHSPLPHPLLGKYPHLVARVASKAAKKAASTAPGTSTGRQSEVTVNFHEVAVGATVEKYIEIANVSPVSRVQTIPHYICVTSLQICPLMLQCESGIGQ